MLSLETEENLNVMMWDMIGLVNLSSSSLASENKCHDPGGYYLSPERGYAGLKTGFSPGGDAVRKAAVVKSGCASEPPWSFKKSECPQYPWASEISLWGRTQISVFL